MIPKYNTIRPKTVRFRQPESCGNNYYTPPYLNSELSEPPDMMMLIASESR